jgi:hypothetical protein
MKVTWVALMLTVASGACKGKEEPVTPGARAADAPEGSGAQQKKVIDLTDNDKVEKVALDSLSAYRAKNLERLADLGPPHAREKLIFIEPRNPNYEVLLGDSSWRMKSLRAWDGKLMKIVRGIQDNALCYYPEDDTHRYAVEVRKDDGHWYFFDLLQEPKDKGAPAPDAP